jgi:hypothetical protein
MPYIARKSNSQLCMEDSGPRLEKGEPNMSADMNNVMWRAVLYTVVMIPGSKVTVKISLFQAADAPRVARG